MALGNWEAKRGNWNLFHKMGYSLVESHFIPQHTMAIGMSFRMRGERKILWYMIAPSESFFIAFIHIHPTNKKLVHSDSCQKYTSFNLSSTITLSCYFFAKCADSCNMSEWTCIKRLKLLSSKRSCLSCKSFKICV